MFLATKILHSGWTSNTNRCLKSCGPKTAPILQSRGRRCFHLADINEVFELLGGLSKDYNQMQLAGHKEAVALCENRRQRRAKGLGRKNATSLAGAPGSGREAVAAVAGPRWRR